MRGIPKYLSTKTDYANFLAMEDVSNEDKVKVLEDLLVDLKEWYYVGPTTKEKGITDETHKVVEERDIENPDVIKYNQYELRDNTGSRMALLGFTEEEVRGLIEKYSK